jgi:hypothetical protein
VDQHLIINIKGSLSLQIFHQLGLNPTHSLPSILSTMKLSIALLSTLSCANAFSLVQNGASRAFMTKLDAQRRQPIMAGAYCKTHDATGRINT